MKTVIACLLACILTCLLTCLLLAGNPLRLTDGSPATAPKCSCKWCGCKGCKCAPLCPNGCCK